MKKNKIVSISLIAAVAAAALAGCSAPAGNTAPVIEGVEAMDCLERQTVDLLNTVRAIDAEDGDITDKMTVSVCESADETRTVAVNDGVVVFEKPGEYVASFSVTDTAGVTVTESMDISVHPRDVYLTPIAVRNDFDVKVTGDADVTTSVKDGNYNIKAAGVKSGDKVSFVRAFPADKNEDVTVEYVFTSSAAGSAAIVIDGVSTAVTVAEGENTVSATHNTAKNESFTSSLELATLGSAFDIAVQKVTVSAPDEAYKERCSDLVFEEGSVVDQHDGDAVDHVVKNIAADGKSCSLAVYPRAGKERQPWFAKLIIETGAQLRAGSLYKVSFKAKAKYAQDINIAYNARYKEANAMDAWTEWSGAHLDGGNVDNDMTFETVIAPESNRGDLRLQLSLGAVPGGKDMNEISVHDISVLEQKAGEYTFGASGFFEKFADDYGGEGTFAVDGDKLLYNVEKFSATDWANELSSRPFTVDDTRNNYVITFRIKATNTTSAVFALPTYGGWDPTLAWQRLTITNEETEYRFPIKSVAESGPYFVLFQFGSEVNTSLPETVIEISEMRIEVMADYEVFN